MEFEYFYSSTFFRGFSWAIICDALQGLSLFHTEVMKTDFTTRHAAVKKAVDFDSTKFQRK
jgi:hypothetical protein